MSLLAAVAYVYACHFAARRDFDLSGCVESGGGVIDWDVIDIPPDIVVAGRADHDQIAAGQQPIQPVDSAIIRQPGI
jgi:hypothetical protein